jgi:hypothetical protein
MDLSTWLLFSSIALVATISPGPAVLLSVTNSLTHGFTKSIFSSLGNITGIFVVSSATALGLGAVLQRSRSKPDRGFASLKCKVSNQQKEPVIEYGYRYLIACKNFEMPRFQN